MLWTKSNGRQTATHLHNIIIKFKNQDFSKNWLYRTPEIKLLLFLSGKLKPWCLGRMPHRRTIVGEMGRWTWFLFTSTFTYLNQFCDIRHAMLYYLLSSGIVRVNVTWCGDSWCHPIESLQVGLWSSTGQESFISFTPMNTEFEIVQRLHCNVNELNLQTGLPHLPSKSL